MTTPRPRRTGFRRPTRAEAKGVEIIFRAPRPVRKPKGCLRLTALLRVDGRKYIFDVDVTKECLTDQGLPAITQIALGYIWEDIREMRRMTPRQQREAFGG